ncbi:hypothetical protein M2451_001336 [Dysgonomonas sp. PFB1-18]|nr:hypothetical protein [Dysgonomonas sp. PF1-14]MDH6338533.1 hypothetical protein [Dysgonomonas sp. PF1-16]MDH6380019.1 hypothetical protein [Dysgonomonas sp. PFB1-18]MDH6397361.1 hypothetical protein [Dysgonomonas sp. PF1-23]
MSRTLFVISFCRHYAKKQKDSPQAIKNVANFSYDSGTVLPKA